MRRAVSILTAVLTVSTFLMTVPTPARATVRGANGRIAFRRYLNANHTRGDIFTISAHGVGERRVTHARRSRLATEPDWSPNGRWLVYQLSRRGDLDDSRLYKIHPNGTHRVSVDASCRAPCRSDGFAQWSPRGGRLAFQRELGPASDPTRLVALYVMRADGARVRRATHRGADPMAHHRFQDAAPTWSPRSKRLAFERVDTITGHHAVFVVRLNGKGLHRITPWRMDAAQPDWSPDGRWILFRSQETSDDSGNVWLVHPGGAGLHRVTHTPPGAGKWGSGSFSPDGRRIVASHSPGTGRAGNADVYVVRLDGSHRRNITSSAAFESAPDWGAR